MKRKILTALALFLVLALACSGICFAETDDTPFFAEEMGLLLPPRIPMIRL